MELFITAKTNITDKDSLEWKHYANLSKADIVERWHTPIGKGLLASLQAGRLSRSTLEQHIGQFNDKFDCRGIPLSGVDCSKLDLSDIDFFAADLSKAIFTGTKLSNSYLSECDIRGAVFDWAKLDGALLDNVKFDNNTRFLGVDIHKIDFTLATFVYDLALSQQRIQQLEQHYKFFAGFLRLSCDYGRSFSRYFLWVLLFIVGFAGIYYALMDKPFFDCLYFSVVTFATVGYGDILPITLLQKAFVIFEILIGYLMGGLLVAILAKRVIG
jgi:hypothetical protein